VKNLFRTRVIFDLPDRGESIKGSRKMTDSIPMGQA